MPLNLFIVLCFYLITTHLGMFFMFFVVSMTTASKYSLRLLLIFLEHVLWLSHCDFLYLDCFQMALLEIIGVELNEAETDFIA